MHVVAVFDKRFGQIVHVQIGQQIEHGLDVVHDGVVWCHGA
jgi:hypothetical protein